MSAERFSADTAQSIGLVSEVVEESMLDQEVQRFVNIFLANAPTAVGTAKKLVSGIANRAITEDLIEQTCTLIAEIRVSPEGQEGLAAFLEKRSPAWINKDGEN